MYAGNEARAGGKTDGRGGEGLGVADTFLGEAIEMRGGGIGVAVAPQMGTHVFDANAALITMNSRKRRVRVVMQAAKRSIAREARIHVSA